MSKLLGYSVSLVCGRLELCGTRSCMVQIMSKDVDAQNAKGIPSACATVTPMSSERGQLRDLMHQSLELDMHRRHAVLAAASMHAVSHGQRFVTAGASILYYI